MTTIEERREAARRLRDYPAELVAAANSTDNACKYYILDLLECVGLGAQNVTSLFERLADLIEPSEPKTTCIAEVKIEGEKLDEAVRRAMAEYAGVDRDALLALADVVHRMGEGYDEHGVYDLGTTFRAIADRIREAVGA